MAWTSFSGQIIWTSGLTTRQLLQAAENPYVGRPNCILPLKEFMCINASCVLRFFQNISRFVMDNFLAEAYVTVHKIFSSKTIIATTAAANMLLVNGRAY